LRKSRHGVVITAVAAPLLVSLVEEDWLSHPATQLILEEYLAPMKAAHVDTVVLACTHYPLLKSLAHRVLGPDVVLVDSAQNAAAALARELKKAGLGRLDGAKAGQTTICSTDVPAQFSRLAERFLGEKIKAIQQVAVS
jgi:glutamate racemase